MPEFHAEAPQTTVSEGLAEGPYVAARAGVEPMTLRTKDVYSTNAPLSLKTIVQAISIALLQIHRCSEALTTQDGYCVGVSRRRDTGNCE